MNAGAAKAVARKWVAQEASVLPGFVGAFFHGSATWLSDDIDLPATSDLDIMVVTDGSDAPPKLGKLAVDGVILDVAFLSIEEIPTPESVLSQYHLASSFRAPGIIADPSGRLTQLQRVVSQHFPERKWVVRRCEHARERLLRGYGMSAPKTFHEQVISWIFPAGITTHILLVAGLKNPTVRTRFVAVRNLLADYDLSSLHDDLLDLVGCRQMSVAQVVRHLPPLIDVFETARAVMETPFTFASDISDIGRPVAIDGTWDLISAGNHREAVFWIVVTWSRCQTVLLHDAPTEVFERFDHGYRALLADLGISSTDDLRQRLDEVYRFTPRVWEVAQQIIAANPDIEDEACAG